MTVQEKIQRLQNRIDHTKSLMDDRRERIQNGETDWDDCFMSERSNSQNIDLLKTKIDILKNGGTRLFDVLVDIETGEVVSKKIIDAQYGLCWIIDDEFKGKFGKFVGYAKRESTYTKKGLKQESRELPAWAKFKTSGSGMMGAYSAYVHVFPCDVNFAVNF